MGLRTDRSVEWIPSVCYFGTAAGADASTDMLLQGHFLPGLQGLKGTLTQKTSLTPFLIASVKKSQRADAGGLAHSSLEDVRPCWRPEFSLLSPR